MSRRLTNGTLKPAQIKVAVAGAGAWGTALAGLAAADGLPVVLWAHEPRLVDEVNQHHCNSAYLPGITLPHGVRATSSIGELCGADVILVAPPAQYVRAVTRALGRHIDEGTPLVLCAKGIEQVSLLLLSQVIAETAPQAVIAVLSGPSFAEDVARGRPTAVTLALADRELGMMLAARLSRPSFRPYVTDDVIGAQIGGAVKNVLAIACGIVDGRELGQSARAALITRGLAEMARLALKLGARPETLTGLSGLGDLVLTCTSGKSRNHAFGYALGKGQSPKAMQDGRSGIVEGAFTAGALVGLCARHDIEMPIAAAVDQVLQGSMNIDQAVESLLSRPLTEEHKPVLVGP